MIKVCLDRKLILDEDYIGTVSENRQPLAFRFPEELKNYTKELIVNKDNGESFRLPITDDVVTLDSDVTGTTVRMQVKCTLGARIFISKSYEVFFYECLDDSGNNQTQVRLVSELAASLHDNFGGDYSGKTWDELIGTLTPQSQQHIISEDEPQEEQETVYKYENGALWDLRTALSNLYFYISPFIHTAMCLPPNPCYDSITAIRTEFDLIKTDIVNAINAVNNPETPFTLESSWYDLTEAIRNLPDEVETLTTASVQGAESEYKLGLESVLDTIVSNYNLDVVLVFGNWQSDLLSVAEVCAALYNSARDSIIAAITNNLYGFYSQYA